MKIIKIIKTIKSLLKKERVEVKSRKFHNIYHKIEGIGLSELELEAWLKSDTALKITRLLKIKQDILLKTLLNPSNTNKDYIVGRCQGYCDIIEFFEESIMGDEDVKDLITDYKDSILINI